MNSRKKFRSFGFMCEGSVYTINHIYQFSFDLSSKALKNYSRDNKLDLYCLFSLKNLKYLFTQYQYKNLYL